MKRLTLLVSGNVQKAGYRDIIIRLGMALGLRGYAENLPDGRVKVVAEGEGKKLELLKESADIKNTLINVEKTESSFSGASGEFSGFFKLVREGETDERLDRAAELLKEVIVAMNQGFSSLNNTMTSGFNRLGEGQDRMLEKQDLHIKITETGFADVKEETAKGFGDMRTGFADVKEEMHKGFGEVKEEIHMLRDDFRELFMHEVSELRSEIAEVKAALAKMQAAG
ncbi:acylphosphatase [groundwater metagenome]